MYLTREQIQQQGRAQAQRKGLYGTSADIYAQAYTEGFIKEYVSILDKILAHMTQSQQISLEQAMDLLNIPETEQSQLRVQLTQAQAHHERDKQEEQRGKEGYFLP